VQGQGSARNSLAVPHLLEEHTTIVVEESGADFAKTFADCAPPTAARAAVGAVAVASVPAIAAATVAAAIVAAAIADVTGAAVAVAANPAAATAAEDVAAAANSAAANLATAAVAFAAVAIAAQHPASAVVGENGQLLRLHKRCQNVADVSGAADKLPLGLEMFVALFAGKDVAGEAAEAALDVDALLAAAMAEVAGVLTWSVAAAAAIALYWRLL